jgi:hypothetical protein
MAVGIGAWPAGFINPPLQCFFHTATNWLGNKAAIWDV